MATVFILSKDGKPLDPTTRCGHVRLLLKQGKARVVAKKPFTIQLLYDVPNPGIAQKYILGIDPGRTNIGVTVVRENGEPVLNVEVQTRNKEVPKLMAARAASRRAHRKNGRRDVRRRRARAAKTTKAESFDRKLPGCEKPITCHDIKNKKARFNNRKRPKGWLTPTANQLLLTHINVVNRIKKFIPISKIVLEINRFAFMKMDNPNIKKWDYQRGPLYKKGSVKDAVYASQDGMCLLCGGKIEHYHHIVSQHEHGSDTLPNIAGLCNKCHDLVHKNKDARAKLQKKKNGLNKKYNALSVLNQIIPFLTDELAKILPTYVTTGYSTKAFRDAHDIQKGHALDAYCIACSILNSGIKVQAPKDPPLIMRQFRRHDRQACHKAMLDRKYYLDGKLVAKNRHKAIEQVDDSLEEFRVSHSETEISRLIVKEHRPQYKNLKRHMPGSIFIADGETHVLIRSTGLHNGLVDYYIDEHNNKYLRKKCIFIQEVRGLRFL